jgi:threonine synthase
VWRGFRDVHELLGEPLPELLGCQPAGAAPLVLTAERGGRAPQTVAEPRTAALSTRDARSGWHATLALQADGYALGVGEEAIVDSFRRLARSGQLVELASAVSLAGVLEARARGLVDPDVTTVCIATSSGQNWTAHLDAALGAPEPVEDVEGLLGSLGVTRLTTRR